MAWHKSLTDREIGICKMVIDGWTYHGVARFLRISYEDVERAVENYRAVTPRDEMRHP